MKIHSRLALIGVLLIVIAAILWVGTKYLLGCAWGYSIAPWLLGYIEEFAPILSILAAFAGVSLILVAFVFWCRQKGDTFIVVTIKTVALIIFLGFVASILIASQNCARCLGPDSRILSSVLNVSAVAEIYHDNNAQTYAGLCASPEINEVRRRINENPYRGGLLCSNTERITCNDTEDGYAFASKLNSNALYYCVDNTGFKGTIDAPPNAITCNGN